MGLLNSRSYSWVRASDGNVPSNAVVAGKDIDGAVLYSGRALHQGNTFPCKIAPSHGLAYVPYDGREIAKSSYEVLCGSGVSWRQAKHDQIPPNAIVGGQTSNGEKLYVGRAIHSGALIPGKVHPSHGCAYVPFAGAEFCYKEYEVAVQCS